MRNSEFLRRLRAAFNPGGVINHLRDPRGELGADLGQTSDKLGTNPGQPGGICDSMVQRGSIREKYGAYMGDWKL